MVTTPMAAASFSSAAGCRMILVVALLIAAATFPSYGAASFVCRGKCGDFQPDCDSWCRTAGGYPKGGQCVPPFDQYCCCIE